MIFLSRNREDREILYKKLNCDFQGPIMSGAKKITTVFDDQVNAKIQRKFDLVFTEKPQSQSSKKDDSSTMFDDEIQFGTGQEDELVMEKNGKESASQINLDFSLDDETPEVPEVAATKSSAEPAASEADDGLDFSLNFDLDEVIETKPEASASPVEEQADESVGFTLDDSDIGSSDMEFDEATKKTVMVNTEELKKSNLAEFSLDNTGSHNGSADHMSNEESRANIESTIKDILRPKFDDTKEIDIGSLETAADASVGLQDIEDSELDFRENTPSKGFALDSMDDDAFAIEAKPSKSAPTPAPMSSDSTGDFDIGSLDTSFNADEDIASFDAAPAEPIVSKPVAAPVAQVVPVVERDQPQRTSTYDAPPSMGMGGSNMTTEDGMRFQATIRALREEREEMLAQIKGLKSDAKELEQDNLTLKANLDEAKIEITILRKRHMVELEDIKYRLGVSEEKKAMSDEKARQADLRREKLEQKVRIDFNQVKQREKELESKLELLSMDVDSQVQSRDQKILELRRKIDALEFNMENASIKEQKSLDDKRKLEDRLNKIMKTLRHSIKNLEDDIDHATEDDDHQKEKN